MFYTTEVTNTTAKQFINLPNELYKTDPSFIAPLQSEIKKIFNPKTNFFFKHGHCTRWLLYDDKKVVGRIAAFINLEKANATPVPTGGIGFFECINNQEAANTLFTTAVNWLKTKDMQAMEGPVNFGENVSWWGLS